ncbi:DNA/RNA polymerases superfamily protein [Gossypium australe]|uniref:DNA/RNA polymerases superfamily protein n=1 Tax=Gossypium australe TaxID=47621 RepID=A0A5B6VAF8_9ROSI|nr:DNA/RNA polymerases superfamily protein [Gossypium australe]
MDNRRFVIPLAFLGNCIFRELFKMSEEEFGLPSDGLITLLCDSVAMSYIVSLAKPGLAKDLERAVLNSITTYCCKSNSCSNQLHADQQSLIKTAIFVDFKESMNSASPMTKLLQKNVQFVWSNECHQSFDQLKRMLTEALVLTQPKFGKEFVVYNDALFSGLGCVLMQAGKLKPHERNYPTHDLELAAIVFSLKIWRQYLYVFDDSVIAELRARPLFLQRIQEFQNDDPKLVAKRELIQSDTTAEFIVSDNGMMYFRNRLCIPDNFNLKRDIFSEAHNSAYSIHLGSMKMFNDLKKMYWSPSLKREISKFVTKCLVCQHVKAKPQVPSRLLQFATIPEWKWERVTMDYS